MASVRTQKPAVLLVNLGTPESPEPRHVRTFLRTFLSDSRVIEMPKALWQPILEGIILRVRPKHSGELYQSVWDLGEVEGSPLAFWSERQLAELQNRLGVEAHVELAMRYSEPTIPHALSDLRARGFERILVVPMYPQYSATTTASIIDEVARWLLGQRDQPEIRTLRSFPESPAYVQAVAKAVEQYWTEHGQPDFAAGDRLLLSFHSIPEAMRKAGDPYHDECEASARLIRSALGLQDEYMLTTYQSVFGPAKWIGPATIDTVGELGAKGVKRVDVVCPGFTADCLETVQEIDMLNRDTFLEAGGQEFHYIPWGNGAEPWIDALEYEVRTRLSGWIH